LLELIYSTKSAYVKVFAHNKKGKSEVVTVAENFLLERPGLQSAGESPHAEDRPPVRR
jgi:hypothetical protein